MNELISYGHQYIDNEDIEEVIKVLRSPWVTQGPRIKEFEQILASHCGAKYCAAFSSGTAALHAAYFAAGIGKGDEIITSPITFAATANAALYLDARPVFADIQADTANLDPACLDRIITGNTKAIVPIHFAGQPADLEEIHSFARKHDLLVIEDACHALGAKYKGKRIGGLSDLTIFSFHPVKTITSGEGGAVLTNRKELYEKMVMFRNHGVTRDRDRLLDNQGDWFYEMHYLGYNYRITDFQCALATSQMKKLNRFISRRREIACRYDEAFRSENRIDPLYQKEERTSAFHIYVVRLKSEIKGRSRKEVFEYLCDQGIGVQVHYIPVYWHPYYQQMGFRKGLCPVAEDYYERAITIPLHASMEKKDVERVIEEVKRAVEQ